MPTLNELLNVNLSYNDILDSLTEETDNFSMESGEVMFDDYYEAQVAADILSNHYENVDSNNMDILDKDNESGFVVKFDGVLDNDIYDFPEEQEEEL